MWTECETMLNERTECGNVVTLIVQFITEFSEWLFSENSRKLLVFTFN